MQTEWTKNQAYDFFGRWLNNTRHKTLLTVSRNRFGHALIATDKGKYYWLYKKDLFKSFNHYFKDYLKKDNAVGGLGESINRQYLVKAIKHKCKLVFTYKDTPRCLFTPSRKKLLTLLDMAMPGANFSMTPTTALLKIYCDYHKLIRKQNKVNIFKENIYSENPVKMQEVTYSFSINLMERLN
jgi:hypothetical protein